MVELIATAKGIPTTHVSHEEHNTIAVELTELRDLRDEGVLTDEEFAQAKARLLDLGD